jgi:hypothetical protein
MAQAVQMAKITLNEFEKFHAPRFRRPPPRATIREVAGTAGVCLVTAPFFFATFFCIPMMGQVTVGFAAFLTAIYLYYRRSPIILVTILVMAVLICGGVFGSIQSVKNKLDVTLFFLIALGIPVSAMYSMFVGMKIWELRGGGE